jgi:hypothetical protein
VRERGLPFYLEVVNLNSGAGDPLARVKKAVQEIKRRSLRRAEFQYRALLMDDDQVTGNNARRLEVEQLADHHKISVVWQTPCHEAFLLRHFAGRLNAAPPNSATAEAQLRQVWAGYVKPMSKLEISKLIDFEGVERVGTQHGSFAQLLRYLELIH